MHMPTKNYIGRKSKKLCLMGQIVIESRRQLSGILTEPLIPRMEHLTIRSVPKNMRCL